METTKRVVTNPAKINTTTFAVKKGSKTTYTYQIEEPKLYGSNDLSDYRNLTAEQLFDLAIKHLEEVTITAEDQPHAAYLETIQKKVQQIVEKDLNDQLVIRRLKNYTDPYWYFIKVKNEVLDFTRLMIFDLNAAGITVTDKTIKLMSEVWLDNQELKINIYSTTKQGEYQIEERLGQSNPNDSEVSKLAAQHKALHRLSVYLAARSTQAHYVASNASSKNYTLPSEEETEQESTGYKAGKCTII